MKPIAVIQNVDTGGPGVFARFAESIGIPLVVFHGHAGAALPASVRDYAGLCVLGGPMSANDDIPYLRHTETLIREAVADDIPVIGHCLGGQLMARAFGAEIVRSEQPEIGWVPLRAASAATAAEWFSAAEFPIYHWHHESSLLPAGALQLARSDYCENQAFALGDRHIGMQFHCEITPQIIDHWLAEPACQRDIARHAGKPAVQNEATMRAATTQHIDASYRVALAIYTRWARHLKI